MIAVPPVPVVHSNALSPIPLTAVAYAVAQPTKLWGSCAAIRSGETASAVVASSKTTASTKTSTVSFEFAYSQALACVPPADTRFDTVFPTAADASPAVTSLHASTEAIRDAFGGLGDGDAADEELDDPQPPSSTAVEIAIARPPALTLRLLRRR